MQTVFLEAFQRSVKDELTVLPLRGMEAERLQPWRAFQQARCYLYEMIYEMNHNEI